jgi:hypothetical protein
MDEESIQKLFDGISTVVHMKGKTWQEKRDMLLVAAADDEKANLEEFAGWFAPAEE